MRAAARGFASVSSRGAFVSIMSRERVSALPGKCLKRMRLCRLEQDVTLLAHRQLDHAFRRQVGRLQHHLLVGDRSIVDAQATALDLAPRLAIGCDKARSDE